MNCMLNFIWLTGLKASFGRWCADHTLLDEYRLGKTSFTHLLMHGRGFMSQSSCLWFLSFVKMYMKEDWDHFQSHWYLRLRWNVAFFFLLLKISVYKGVSLSRFAPVSIEFCEGQKRVLEHMDLELHELMGTV